jgi:hypothetical protein
MRTILAGIRALRRTPLATLPLTIEGLIGAVLILVGAIPATGAGVPSTAAFPLDIFFDLKQAVAFSTGWGYFAAAVGLGILVRSGILAATLWLSDGRPGPFAVAWARTMKLALIAAVALVPSAALFFAGVATRYAPFVWLAALLGVVASVLLVRRAMRMDMGGGDPRGKGVPEAPNFISYVYLIIAFGAAMSVLSDGPGKWASALLLACLGPLHALFVLGWREHVRVGTFPGGGTIVTVASALVLMLFFGLTAYDRFLRNPAPVRKAPRQGMLLVLGGADSTSRRGALADVDPRLLGYMRSSARQLSYKGPGKPYGIADTRKDLNESARIISKQIATAKRPRALLGHSQAELIFERMMKKGMPLPERAVFLASQPPTPPGVEVPPPNKDGEGRPGGDLARGLSWVLEKVGFEPFNIDAPNSPTNINAVVVKDAPVPRLTVWTLGDSVWLDGDWRRPGEINIVALTDHVGVTDNAYAFDSAAKFYAGEKVEDDETSWKGVAVGVLKYAFEPWRPE